MNLFPKAQRRGSAMGLLNTHDSDVEEQNLRKYANKSGSYIERFRQGMESVQQTVEGTLQNARNIGGPGADNDSGEFSVGVKVSTSLSETFNTFVNNVGPLASGANVNSTWASIEEEEEEDNDDLFVARNPSALDWKNDAFDSSFGEPAADFQVQTLPNEFDQRKFETAGEADNGLDNDGFSVVPHFDSTIPQFHFTLPSPSSVADADDLNESAVSKPTNGLESPEKKAESEEKVDFAVPSSTGFHDDGVPVVPQFDSSIPQFLPALSSNPGSPVADSGDDKASAVEKSTTAEDYSGKQSEKGMNEDSPTHSTAHINEKVSPKFPLPGASIPQNGTKLVSPLGPSIATTERDNEPSTSNDSKEREMLKKLLKELLREEAENGKKEDASRGSQRKTRSSGRHRGREGRSRSRSKSRSRSQSAKRRTHNRARLPVNATTKDENDKDESDRRRRSHSASRQQKPPKSHSFTQGSTTNIQRRPSSIRQYSMRNLGDASRSKEGKQRGPVPDMLSQSDHVNGRLARSKSFRINASTRTRSLAMKDIGSQSEHSNPPPARSSHVRGRMSMPNSTLGSGNNIKMNRAILSQSRTQSFRIPSKSAIMVPNSVMEEAPKSSAPKRGVGLARSRSVRMTRSSSLDRSGHNGMSDSKAEGSTRRRLKPSLETDSSGRMERTTIRPAPARSDRPQVSSTVQRRSSGGESSLSLEGQLAW